MITAFIPGHVSLVTKSLREACYHITVLTEQNTWAGRACVDDLWNVEDRELPNELEHEDPTNMCSQKPHTHAHTRVQTCGRAQLSGVDFGVDIITAGD